MTKEYKFLLVNADGCEMMDVRTDNFKNARGTFAQYYSGKYKIIWTDKYGQRNEKNVRLQFDIATTHKNLWVVWSANSYTAINTGDPSRSLSLQKITVDILRTI